MRSNPAMPERTKAATAPATVSGEQCRNTTGRKTGKVGKAMTRKSGDLPSKKKPKLGRGVRAGLQLTEIPVPRPPLTARRAHYDLEDNDP